MRHAINHINSTCRLTMCLNNELLWQLNRTNRRQTRQCRHLHECGCNKPLCNNCNIRLTCQFHTSEEIECNRCGKSLTACSNPDCKSYYENRHDNCHCQRAACLFCHARTRRENEQLGNTDNEI